MFGNKEEYVLHERKFKKRKKPEKEAAAPVAAENADAWERSKSTDRNITIDEMLDCEAEPEGKEEMTTKVKKAPFYKNRKTVGWLLIGSSLVITLMVFPTLSYFNQKETATVVVATVEIMKGDVIEDSMIKATTVSAGAVLPIQELDIAAVQGKYAKSDITMGEILSAPKLSSELPFDNAYLYTLPKGKKAMSVMVGKLSADVSGKLEPGDVVSVYVAATSEDGKDIRLAMQLPQELTYVEVLSTTNTEGIDITATPEQSELENPLPSTVTLAVDNMQAIILAGSEVKGGVHLALVKRRGEDADALLEEQRLQNIEAAASIKAEAADAAASPEQPDPENPSSTEPGEVFKFEQ